VIKPCSSSISAFVSSHQRFHSPCKCVTRERMQTYDMEVRSIASRFTSPFVHIYFVTCWHPTLQLFTFPYVNDTPVQHINCDSCPLLFFLQKQKPSIHHQLHLHLHLQHLPQLFISHSYLLPTTTRPGASNSSDTQPQVPSFPAYYANTATFSRLISTYDPVSFPQPLYRYYELCQW
jgi:hypothetical protein